MKKIPLYILLFFVKIIGFFNFDSLHKAANVVAFILQKIIKYRQKVVFENLNIAFPNFSFEQKKQIENQFYIHLADLIFESLKSFSLKNTDIIPRYKLLNPEVLDQYYHNNQSIIVTGGHYNNWEWAVAADAQCKHKTVAVYKPIANKPINDYMVQNRTKWGSDFSPIQDTSLLFEKNKNTPTAYLMVADQSPSNVERAYWVNFFGVPTATLHGVEKYAQQYNLPVIYFEVQKIARSEYTLNFKVISEPNDTQQKEKGYITQVFMSELQKTIEKDPPYWLWSHRRWKHKLPPQTATTN